MATARATTYSPPVNAVPYVGLRPFEPSERDRFFGRDRDAQVLCDRVLSSRVTILYALSGLGKSSLLRALVIPQLEDSHARVVYFDAWAQADPLRALKDALAAAASQRGVPQVDHGSLSLCELARLLLSGDDHGLVLVFDQFEEFLVRHAQNLDPLRSELAALVRASKLDVAVVLTLREEFLASLEPFRQQILNLFHSAYRLENLSNEDLSKAIREPAILFGGECEEALADQLVRDLEGGAVDVAAGPQLSLGLPMLQLVCQELWKRAPDRRLSLSLYKDSGGTQRMIEDYVRGLMPKERVREDVTADLLIYLAPASGLKMGYSVKDLAAITDLPPAVIENELKPLKDARILRTRDSAAGVRYELEHDAFIPVLRSWREEVLERKRRRERGLRLAKMTSVFLVILLAACYALWLREVSRRKDTELVFERHIRELKDAKAKIDQQQRESEQQLHESKQKEAMDSLKYQTELAHAQAAVATANASALRNWQEGGLLNELEKKSASERKVLAPSYFDMLVAYVLWHETGEGRLDQLREKLKRYEGMIPDDYYVQMSKEEDSKAGEGWPLQVQYSQARKMDEPSFNAMWRPLAKQAAEERGMPIPLKVRLVPREKLPQERIRIDAGGPKPVILDVPAGDRFLILALPSSLNASPERDFLERFQHDWMPFESREGWLLVPKWSLPVWKAAMAEEYRAYGPSGIVAYLAIQDLFKAPEAVFSADAVEAVLQHARENFKATVDEAQSARGGQLGVDLAKRVQGRKDALMALPQILDQLAEQPNKAADIKRPASAGATLDQSSANDREHLWGPLPPQAAKAKAHDSNSNNLLNAAAQQRQLAFLEVETLLPEYSPVRVYFGSGLVPEWFPGDKLSSSLSETLNSLRDEMYRSYGVSIPGYRFRGTSDIDRLSPNAIRIEMQDDPPLRDFGDQKIPGPNTLKSLAAALRATDERTLPYWITPETTQPILSGLPPNTKLRLESKYSVTDLKRLLRRVVKLDSAGVRAPGTYVRYPTWLITSLVFWNLIDENNMDVENMAKHLRETEEAPFKLGSGQIQPSSSPIGRHLENGVKALVADDVKTADYEFGEAKRLDSNQAARLFPALWSQQLPAVWLRDFRQDYPVNVDTVTLSHPEQMDLQDLSGIVDPKSDGAAWRELSLYRLASNEYGDGDKATSIVTRLLTSANSPDDWRPDQASWLALRFLKKYDPLNPETGNAQQLASASALLESAVRRFDSQDQAFQSFLGLEDIAANSKAPNWSWQLLDRLAAVRPGGALQNLQLELAFQLCYDERSSMLRHALELAQNYEKILATSQVTEDQRRVANENLQFVRTMSYYRLVQQGEEQYHAEAEKLYRGLLDSKYDPVSKQAYSDLIRMLYDDRQAEEAQKLNKTAQAKWPDSAPFVGLELLEQLKRSNVTSVRATTRLAAQKAAQLPNENSEKASWLLFASLGSLLTGSSDSQKVAAEFLATSHKYHDYVLMIAYTYGGGRASPAMTKLLADRWAEIHPSTWPDRFRNGDASAWREMLIGRFMGAAESAKIYNILESEDAWQRSDVSHLPESRRGQLCEAWFYDAMNARANGSPERMRESLRRSIDSRFTTYIEYSMAVFVLSQAQLENRGTKQ